MGNWLVLAQWKTDVSPWTLITVKTARVGDNGILPDVAYKLNDAGEFVEAK